MNRPLSRMPMPARRLLRSLRNVVFGVLLALAALVPARAGVEIAEVTSPGGITAWLVEDHTLPFVSFEIRFRGGAALDRPGKEGETMFMAGLLEEGAGEMDSRAFAREVERLGADFAFDADLVGVNVSAKMLTEDLADAADLLRLALTRPRFDPSAIDRVRGQVLAYIDSREKDPEAIASRMLMARLFAGHPFGRPPEGTRASVERIGRDDLLQAHRRALSRDHLVIGVAGDITPEALAPLLDRIFADLPARGAPLPPRTVPKVAGAVETQPFPSPQSVILFAQRGIDRTDPDFFAAHVLNQIIGGGFNARLMQELREKRGLTYGIGTWLADLGPAEYWGGQTRTVNATAGQAVALIRKVWADVAAGNITEDELQAAKRYMTGSYPLRFDSNGRIAAILAGMQIAGFPRDYPNFRNARIEAVTLADLKRVARRLMTPDRLEFVVVGRPEGL